MTSTVSAASAGPDRYAVLGNPVAHSQSPRIHAAFAAATGQHLVYERLLSPLDAFAATVRAFAATGARGCNVTAPFKFEALALAGQASDRARRAGAANVLTFNGPDSADWVADNSDGVGLVRDLVVNAGQRLEAARVLLVGSGGAAAGVLGPLLEQRPALLAVVNRTGAHAEALVRSHADLAAAYSVELVGAGLAAAGSSAAWQGFDMVINASASSLGGAGLAYDPQASPVPARVLGSGTLVVDLMYGAAALPFLAWAGAHGARARDGLGMLVEQAAEAFLLWRGVLPATAPVLAALRSA